MISEYPEADLNNSETHSDDFTEREISISESVIKGNLTET